MEIDNSIRSGRISARQILQGTRVVAGQQQYCTGPLGYRNAITVVPYIVPLSIYSLLEKLSKGIATTTSSSSKQPCCPKQSGRALRRSTHPSPMRQVRLPKSCPTKSAEEPMQSGSNSIQTHVRMQNPPSIHSFRNWIHRSQIKSGGWNSGAK